MRIAAAGLCTLQAPSTRREFSARIGLARAADDASISQSGIIAGTPVLIEMKSTQFDTLVRLEDTKRKMVVENDDINLRNKNLNSRIFFFAKQNGTYRLIATSYQQRDRGAYDIIIRQFHEKKIGNLAAATTRR